MFFDELLPQITAEYSIQNSSPKIFQKLLFNKFCVNHYHHHHNFHNFHNFSNTHPFLIKTPTPTRLQINTKRALWKFLFLSLFFFWRWLWVPRKLRACVGRLDYDEIKVTLFSHTNSSIVLHYKCENRLKMFVTPNKWAKKKKTYVKKNFFLSMLSGRKKKKKLDNTQEKKFYTSPLFFLYPPRSSEQNGSFDPAHYHNERMELSVWWCEQGRRWCDGEKACAASVCVCVCVGEKWNHRLRRKVCTESRRWWNMCMTWCCVWREKAKGRCGFLWYDGKKQWQTTTTTWRRGCWATAVLGGTQVVMRGRGRWILNERAREIWWRRKVRQKPLRWVGVGVGEGKEGEGVVVYMCMCVTSTQRARRKKGRGHRQGGKKKGRGEGEGKEGRGEERFEEEEERKRKRSAGESVSYCYPRQWCASSTCAATKTSAYAWNSPKIR